MSGKRASRPSPISRTNTGSPSLPIRSTSRRGLPRKAMTRSGSRERTTSTFGSTRPPILGRALASGGQSQKRVTPTTRPPRPRAKRISVMFGAMETILSGVTAGSGNGRPRSSLMTCGLLSADRTCCSETTRGGTRPRVPSPERRLVERSSGRATMIKAGKREANPRPRFPGAAPRLAPRRRASVSLTLKDRSFRRRARSPADPERAFRRMSTSAPKIAQDILGRDRFVRGSFGRDRRRPLRKTSRSA